MERKELHIISNGKLSGRQLAELASDIHPYVDFLHLREKTKTAGELVDMIDYLGAHGVPKSKVIINDRVDVAVVKKCKGVQLAYHSLGSGGVKNAFPHLTVGRSVHSIQEALLSEKEGADFVLYGHIYKTSSKPNTTPKGLSRLREITKAVTIPVIAIGGIQPEHVQNVLNAGAKGIAIMSGILEASNPLQTVKEYDSQLTL